MSQAPPPRSPDGQWWWDGRQWVPVQQQPPVPAPPNGPARPRRSAAPWIVVVAVVAAVVIIGLVAGGTLWIRTLQAATETTPLPRTASADRPPPSPSPSPTGPGPVRCQPRTSEGCFPKVSVSKLAAALRAKGFQCEKSGSYGTRCTKRISGRDQHTFALNHSLRDADRLTSLMALGSSSAVGAGPPDRTGQANRRTVEALQLGLDQVLPAASTRRKIADWAREHQGRCADTLDVHQVIDGYELRCSNPEAIAVKDTQIVTTWSGSVTIGAGRLR